MHGQIVLSLFWKGKASLTAICSCDPGHVTSCIQAVFQFRLQRVEVLVWVGVAVLFIFLTLRVCIDSFVVQRAYFTFRIFS